MTIGASTRARVGRVGLVALALVGCCVALALASAQTPPEPATGASNDAVCSAYCSREHLGLSVIELRWPLSESPAGAADAKALLAKQTIEVTTYADGFERKLFATLTGPAVGKRFQMAENGDRYKDRPKSLPGLGRLAITDVVTASEPAAASPLRLLMAPGIRAATVVVRISGLEGGMDYKFRLPSASSSGGTVVVTCTAARCPVDDFGSPKKKRSPSAKAQPKGGAQ